MKAATTKDTLGVQPEHTRVMITVGAGLNVVIGANIQTVMIIGVALIGITNMDTQVWMMTMVRDGLISEDNMRAVTIITTHTVTFVVSQIIPVTIAFLKDA